MSAHVHHTGGHPFDREITMCIYVYTLCCTWVAVLPLRVGTGSCLSASAPLGDIPRSGFVGLVYVDGLNYVRDDTVQ